MFYWIGPQIKSDSHKPTIKHLSHHTIDRFFTWLPILTKQSRISSMIDENDWKVLERDRFRKQNPHKSIEYAIFSVLLDAIEPNLLYHHCLASCFVRLVLLFSQCHIDLLFCHSFYTVNTESNYEFIKKTPLGAHQPRLVCHVLVHSYYYYYMCNKTQSKHYWLIFLRSSSSFLCFYFINKQLIRLSFQRQKLRIQKYNTTSKTKSSVECSSLSKY